MTYPVADIFATLQGEGHFVGYPAVFVRLAGCSVLGCSIRSRCDEAPWKARETLDAGLIVDRVRALAQTGIVVITGGEPSDHDLRPLVDALTLARYRIHVETSGVRSLAGLPVEWLTVSPKTPDYVQRLGHTLKVVVKPGMGWPSIWSIDTDTNFFHRYLQPLTDPATGRAQNLEQTIALLTSRENEGARWALSTQAHRTWGVR